MNEQYSPGLRLSPLLPQPLQLPFAISKWRRDQEREQERLRQRSHRRPVTIKRSATPTTTPNGQQQPPTPHEWVRPSLDLAPAGLDFFSPERMSTTMSPGQWDGFLLAMYDRGAVILEIDETEDGDEFIAAGYLKKEFHPKPAEASRHTAGEQAR